MKNLRYTILTILIAMMGFGFSQTNNIVDGQLLIMLRKGVSPSTFIEEVNPNFPGLELETKEKISKRINVWLFTFNGANYSSQQALEIINSNTEVIISQFNHSNINSRGDTCPNDPNFGSQWHLKNTGQSGGVVGADIDACKAWGITTQTSTALGEEIVIAVIDDGFYLAHEDINYFENVNEIPSNGIDDDGNGYIDDTLGWNTYNDTNAITSKSHGTHVSGIIGAVGNNGVGVSGVNWGMKIMPIQGSSGLESTVLKSYGYALEMRALYDSTNGAKGAFVVATNSSFGVDNGDPSSFPLWCAFYDSLGAYGILSAAATSNSNTNVDVNGDIPTTCTSDFLISVTNTNRYDSKASAGFGGIHIDIGAPGSSVRSTLPNNNYGTRSGTSQSTPVVSGAIGFMHAVACNNFASLYKSNPDSIALVIKKVILDYGDSISGLKGITVSGNRVNLYNSAIQIRLEGACNSTSISDIEVEKGNINLYPNPNDGNFSFSLKGFKTGDYSYSIIDVSGKLIQENNFSLSSDNQMIEVNSLNQIDKGVYFLCLRSSFGTAKFVRFVVN